jgi:DNA-directed RNA polymerase specialized sigma subunit
MPNLTPTRVRLTLSQKVKTIEESKKSDFSREKICKEFGISKATISQISFSNLRAHLMSLGEDIEAFDSLKKLERIFIKKNIEESQSKQTNITKKFPVNQLKLK